jgi:lysophospholipase L1-like esterase
VPKLRVVLSNSLLALAGVVATLFIAEGLAGLLWEAPWYERLLREQEEVQQYPYRRNSFGLRGPEPTIPKPEGTQRVLVTGDSFTFGLGLENDAEPFPAVLERRLAESGSRVDVVNGGISGSLTGDWAALWRRAGASLDPDVVIAVFFLRDGTRLGTIPDFFGEIRRDISERNADSTLYRYSHLYRRVRDYQDRFRVGELFTESLVDAYLGEETKEWERAQRNLLELRNLVHAEGAIFGLAVFPVLVELGPDYPFQGVVDSVLGFARDGDIPAHDLLPAFLGRKGPDLWVSPVDQHPNAEGHAIAAESLLPFARALLEKSRGDGA